MEIEGKVFFPQIWDTAGQERFRMTPYSTYYRAAHGIAIMYSIADRDSFDDVTQWVAEVGRHAREGIDIMLVGCKCDLDSERQVLYEEGEQLAESLGFPFVETSSKMSINVEAMFTALALEILYSINPRPFFVGLMGTMIEDNTMRLTCTNVGGECLKTFDVEAGSNFPTWGSVSISLADGLGDGKKMKPTFFLPDGSPITEADNDKLMAALLDLPLKKPVSSSNRSWTERHVLGPLFRKHFKPNAPRSDLSRN